MAPILKVDSIVTRFGRNLIHDGLTFEIDKPGVVALIGGSGSGKSVLLKEIIGLLRPTSGTVQLLGCNVWHAPIDELERMRRRFGVLFQNGALFSALDVEENVAVPFVEQLGLSPELIPSLVELRLALSGLSLDTCSKMPSELSGGMRKRVALARALALEPEILFLDEPTSGLDPINARAFDRLVRTLCDSLGLTVVLVTHDLDTIFGIVDRVVALEHGKIVADGTVSEVIKVKNDWIRSYFSARASGLEHGAVS